MNWFDEQLETRRRLDDEQVADAFERIARGVAGAKRAPRLTLDSIAATDSALASVLRYFGKAPVEIPASITDADERIDYQVRASGLMRRPVRLEGPWWKDAAGAYLGQLASGEPIAIIPLGLRGYAYVEPVTGRKVNVSARTATDILPEALCFYRTLPNERLTATDLVRFMRSSMGAGDYLRVAFATLVASLTGMIMPVANNLLFENVIPSSDPGLLLPILAMLLGSTFATALIGVSRSMLTARLSSKVSQTLQAALMARILQLPPAFFKGHEAGSIARRVTDAQTVVELLAGLIVTSGLTAAFSLVYIAQVSVYAPSLLGPTLAIVGVQLAIAVVCALARMSRQREIMRRGLEVSGMVPALLGGISKIKLAGAEKRAFAKWADAEASYLSAQYDLPLWQKVSDSVPPLVAAFGAVAIYWFAGTGGVSVANFMAFNVAYGAISAAMVTLAGTGGQLARIQSLFDALQPILDAAPETHREGRQVTSLGGSIELSGVTFRYQESQPPVLSDLTLRIRPGEYLAVVGASGSGKSTLLRLLLGFETPERGAIYYGGQDISDFDVRSLRRNIGVCLQNGSLFAGTILSNITLANPRATVDDAWEAAELAGVADDIRQMPMDMQTLVSEGSGGISGGQRQRILIARAVCAKPSILMFDEATSALDNVTQRHVSDSLAGLKCTRIVVAHRLSTIRLADRIVMLDGGHIVEEGTYDELMEADGAFADLVRRQRLEGV